MSETFVEQLVVRENTASEKLKTTIYVLVVFLVPAIFVVLGVSFNFYFIVVAICAFFFAAYAAYYLITGLYVEYEYAVTNSNLTIDRITAKRKRKMLVNVDIKRFNTFKKVSEGNFNKTYKKIFKASVSTSGDDVYAAEMHLEKFGGDCLLLFSPDEKTLKAMKPYIKKQALV